MVMFGSVDRTDESSLISPVRNAVKSMATYVDRYSFHMIERFTLFMIVDAQSRFDSSLRRSL